MFYPRKSTNWKHKILRGLTEGTNIKGDDERGRIETVCEKSITNSFKENINFWQISAQWTLLSSGSNGSQQIDFSLDLAKPLKTNYTAVILPYLLFLSQVGLGLPRGVFLPNYV